MKKLARKKWESDDPAVHQREPQNLENSGTFEIIRQEEVNFFELKKKTENGIRLLKMEDKDKINVWLSVEFPMGYEWLKGEWLVRFVLTRLSVSY